MISKLEAVLAFVLIALTATLFAMNMRYHAQTGTREFQTLTQDSVDVLKDRLQTYLLSVKGTAAFVAASDDVSVGDFEVYTQRLNLEEQLPSISALGLIVEVPEDEIASFAQMMREKSDPNFDFRNLSSEDTHYILKYIQPLDGNEGVAGLDVGFTKGRAEVMLAARGEGAARLTRPVTLVQESDDQAGSILFMPIYAPSVVEGEADVFRGWISAVFVLNDLFSELTAGQGASYSLVAYDGASGNDGAFLYSEGAGAPANPEFLQTYQINHFGRTWTLEFSSTPQFEAGLGSYQPLSILISGFALTALLLSILRSIRRRGETLKEMSGLMTRQIKAREQENRSIIENDITPVFLLDEDDRVLFANQAAQQCFGYNGREMNLAKLSSLAQKASPDDGSFDAKGKAADGRLLELEVHRSDWINSGGEKRSTVIMRDLTAQNIAERELRQSKLLFDLALEGSEIGVFDIDLMTSRSEVSDTWCRIMGYPKGCQGDDTQQNFLARIHPDDLSILKQADADCIDGKTARSISEYRLKSKEGHWGWMRSDAVVVERDASGKALRMIGTQTDVTEERRNRNALEDSERMFRQVIENAPIGMALMDDEGRFIGVNSALSMLAGVSVEELLERRRLSDFIPEEDRKLIYTAVSKMTRDQKDSVYSAEHRLILSSGEERWGLLSVSGSFDKNAGRYFFIAQVIDVTDQKKIHQMKDEFVSTVSHELRTPLTSIKGALGLLMVSPHTTLTASQLRLIEIATSNANRLTDIVNDILDLEKISSGEVTFNTADLDLNEIVNISANEMSPFAVTQSSAIAVDLPDDPTMVCVDPGRTQQVLANLISNACKYSDPDTEVLVKAERLGDLAIVYVQNVGPGVPDNFRSRIFQPFSQADSSDTRTKGGTGLGLNISRQIVLRQGGEIGFESKPGGITVFWFTVPILTAVPPVADAAPVASVSLPRRKVNILHVEDDHDFAEVLEGALTEFATVEHAKSLLVAKKRIATGRFDIIILDWSLPDGDASTLMNQISLRQPDAKIIGLSANSYQSDDPRLFANMVKSRTELSSVVESVNACAT